VAHKLQLKGGSLPGGEDREAGCEGFCQFSVVALMIDRYIHITQGPGINFKQIETPSIARNLTYERQNYLSFLDFEYSLL
jgi:hypothetical protein